MKYISTRGTAPVLDFEGAMISGLARDGGLYLPEHFPTFSVEELRALRGQALHRCGLCHCQALCGWHNSRC